MCYVVGMFDLYLGCGYFVGVVFFLVGCLYLVLIGNDIGCGMMLWVIDFDVNKISLDKFEKCFGNIDGLLDESWSELVVLLVLYGIGFDVVFGIIGGGNYFVEL